MYQIYLTSEVENSRAKFERDVDGACEPCVTRADQSIDQRHHAYHGFLHFNHRQSEGRPVPENAASRSAAHLRLLPVPITDSRTFLSLTVNFRIPAALIFK